MSDDSRFSASSATPAGGKPAGQDLGFFTSAPVGAPSPFGGPPAQLPPQGPFAAAAQPDAAPSHPPQQYPPQQYPPQQYPQQQYPPVQRRGLPVWAIIAICVPVTFVVLAILAAIAIPVFLNQRSTPVMPDSLSGVSRTTDPAMTEAVEEVHKELSQQNPGRKVDVAGYGTRDAGYVLMGLGGPVEAAREFSAFGVTSELTSFGDVQCGTNADLASLCVRSGIHGTVEVAQVGAGASELSQLAAVTDKAWAAQPFGS